MTLDLLARLAAFFHVNVAALLVRQGEIRRQASRVNQSLEAMTIRGDTFAGRELRQLLVHPLLCPLLERLVLVGEGSLG